MINIYNGSDSLSELKNKGLANLGIGLIKLYQRTISEITPPRCRHRPSCSQYAIEAIERFGFVEGVKLARKRIKRCKPPNCGYDPVPIYLSNDNETIDENKIPVMEKNKDDKGKDEDNIVQDIGEEIVGGIVDGASFCDSWGCDNWGCDTSSFDISGCDTGCDGCGGCDGCSGCS